MREISFAWAVSYGAPSPKQKYMPAIKMIGDSLCACYGISFPRGYNFKDEPVNKMHLSRVSTLTSRYLIRPMGKMLRYPDYYTYWSNIKIFDYMYAGKVSRDDSKIVFTSPLLINTIRSAKKNGKTIVVEAGNSEPEREYRRIQEEYKKFNIQNQFIYGNHMYAETCRESLEMADYIIAISDVSLNTYLEAGYNESKFKLISMAGTDFKLQPFEVKSEKRKAFISTAYHNFIKGTHRLLLAWKKAGIKGIPLIIVGKLSDDMDEFVEKYGPFDNVIFVGQRNDLKEWYKNYDAVGVLLSLSEGAVRVTPEMMSFGFPMIVSPDATCDLVKDGYNGRVVNPTDEKGIVDALKYYSDDWNRVRNIRKNVLESVSKRTMKDYSLELGEYLLSLTK